MRDDAWWDGADEDVAALQRVLVPLRERPRSWGDVLAQARVSASLPRRPRTALAIGSALLGAAAAIVLTWWWGRSIAMPQASPAGDGEQAELSRTGDAPAEVVPIAGPPPPPPAAPSKPPVDEAALLRAIEALERAEAQARALAPPPPPRAPARARPRPPRNAPATPPPPPRPAPPPGPDVDCILAPHLDKCLDTAPADGLPETLGTAEVKRGLAPHKAAAQACGGHYGAPTGEQVKVKLTIGGASGRVIAAIALPPHAGTSLGDCVVEVLSRAQFPRFRKATLGVVFPVKM